jgi:hypothetical protein
MPRCHCRVGKLVSLNRRFDPQQLQERRPGVLVERIGAPDGVTQRIHRVVPADVHQRSTRNRSTLIRIGAADGVLVPATPGEGDIVEALKMVTFVQVSRRTLRRDIQPACWQTGSDAASP